MLRVIKRKRFVSKRVEEQRIGISNWLYKSAKRKKDGANGFPRYVKGDNGLSLGDERRNRINELSGERRSGMWD
jgi:hypothetical protein